MVNFDHAMELLWFFKFFLYSPKTLWSAVKNLHAQWKKKQRKEREKEKDVNIRKQGQLPVG